MIACQRLAPVISVFVSVVLMCSIPSHGQFSGGGTGRAALTGSDGDNGASALITVGDFESAEECSVYSATSGSFSSSSGSAQGASIGEDGLATASASQSSVSGAFETELFRDCVSQFARLKQSIEAALASSGRVEVVKRGTRGALTLAGRVSTVGLASTQSVDDQGEFSDGTASVDVQFNLSNAQGRSVFGNIITKKIVVGENHATDVGSSSNALNDNAVYAQLQKSLSFAIARSVIFQLSPIIVTSVNDRRIQLNYGSTMLPLGSTVFVDDGSGFSIKLNVASVTSGYVWAEPFAPRDMSVIQIGDAVRYVEAEDPSANARVLERAEWPF